MYDENKINDTKEFISTMPEIDFCVGYGSGFIKQFGNTSTNRQRDLLIGVENVKEFVKKNLKLNPKNYSNTEFIYYKFLSFMHNIGTEINFSPYHNFKGTDYKIGIFSTKYLEKELLINKDGYLPGRLAKNIVKIKVNDYHQSLIDYNVKCTLITALLLEENGIDKYQLLKTIAGFSYMGDWRKYIGLERKDKIDKLLFGSYQEFNKLYADDELYITDEKGKINKVCNINDHLNCLQIDMLNYLNKHNYKYRNNENRKAILEQYLFEKNFVVTPLQGIKGIISVGPKKLLRYNNDKQSKK